MYNKRRLSSFHTPGHKGDKRFLPKEISKIDLTELADTDNLYAPRGEILKAEERAALIFGAKRTLFSTGGCTLCVQTMIKQLVKEGDKILVDRNVHISAVNTFALLGVEPIWIYPRDDAGGYAPGRINPEDIEIAIKKNTGVKGLYLTSPNYYGVMYDLKGIIDVCKRKRVAIILDNAHGSHLYFSEERDNLVVPEVAMVSCSLHKTMPVFTGGAILNINDSSYIEDAKGAMSIFGSSSPSYPIMTSIDCCMDWLSKRGEEELLILRGEIRKIKEEALERGIRQPIGKCDDLRISLHTSSVGIKKEQILNLLEDEKIEAEYVDNNSVVFIVSPMNRRKDILRLRRFIKRLPILSEIHRREIILEEPERRLGLREAMMRDFEYKDTLSSKGRISAGIIFTCPPGIPIVLPGEVINREAIEIILKNGIERVKVVK